MRSTGSDRLKSAGEIALTGLQTTLQVAKDASGTAGIPGLVAGIAGLAAILDAVQQTMDNAESANRLLERVVELDKMLRNVITTRTLPQTMLMRVLELLKKWENEGNEIYKLRSRSRMRRFLGSKNDAKAVAGHLEAIDQSIRDFMLESTFRTEMDVRSLRDDFRAHDVKVLLGFEVNLPHSKAAHFDYAYDNISRTGCTNGTRTDILQKLNRWVNTQHTSGESARIFWINGMAGTGKTTIAYTVSKYCRDSGVPLATFFCSRDGADTSNPNLVFPTIARQLGIINEAFAQELSNSFRTHPDTVYSAISHQLEMLLVKPLNAAKDQFPHCVVVLDALDECKDDSSTSIILSSLSHHINKLPSAIQFLITSRPEPSITQGFRQRVLHTATQSFNLHEEALGTVGKDIELYLTESLHSMRDDYELEDSWPSTPDIKSLAGLSGGLFIYAATAVKFIVDVAYDHPKDQLQRLLHNQGGTSGSLTQRLDELYMEILEVALKNIAAERRDLVKLVLSSIVLLRDPLSSSDLEHLLNLEPGTVKRALRRLHSALDIPDDDIRAIRLIHPSFHDFMVDASRCTIPRVAIIPDDHHEVLARACLDALLKGLRRNICDLQDPSKLNSEVDDIQDRIASRISLDLQYSCRHWMWHTCRSRVTDILLETMHDFVRTKFLYWIEVCSLLGELRTALIGLDEVQRWFATSGADINDTTKLLYDGERFIREFFPVLSTSSLHTYYSALVWTPLKSFLRATYEHELLNVVKLMNFSSYHWSSCLQTLEGHTQPVYSVSFSHDGTKIISGSRDRTIRLWDAVTGALLKIFEGHSGDINGVAVSLDDSTIISGSDDCTIRLWDMSTGAQLRILQPHSEVRDIATSTKDNWVACSAGNVIQLWDISTGVVLRTLGGHNDFVSCVTFSEDGEWIVSGGNDLQVRVWQAESGVLRATLKGHESSISAVACSPDGKIIISGSSDCTARVWNAETGSLLMTRTFDHWVVSIVFIPLTNAVACAGGVLCNHIEIWDPVTGNLLRTLEARDSGNQSLAISQDGMHIASGGYDEKIQVWRVASAAQETEYILEVNFVEFSPDGSRVVSAADHRLFLWDAHTGTLLRTLEGHELPVITASFSMDSTQLLSGSDDKTIRLWDVETGITLTCLQGHDDSVQFAKFFPGDGTRIISRSMDSTIRIWDMTVGTTVQIITVVDPGYRLYTALSPSGDQVAVVVKRVVQIWNLGGGASGLQTTLEGHRGAIIEVVFSMDGTQIITCSYDGTVRMWDGATGIEVKTFEIGGSPRRLMFSPDEKSIFTSLGPIVIPKDYLPARNSENAGRLSSASAVGYFIKSGWLCTQHPMRRVCWIPPAWRPREELVQSEGNPLSLHGNRVVFCTVSGVVFLDTTDAVAELF